MANLNESETQRSNADTGILARIGRLDRLVWIVLTAWVILGLFVVWGRIHVGEAIVPAFTLLALAAFLPRQQSMRTPEMIVTSAQEELAEPVVASVADALSEPTLVLDRKSTIIHRNPSAAAEFPQAEVGSPVTYAFRQPSLIEAVNKARNTGMAQRIELQQSSPSLVWYAVSIAPFSIPGMPEVDAGRFLITFTNLTEQRRTEAMRVDFVANASHELRTPLTSVVGFIDTLLGPAAEDPEARKRFLTIMRAQAERMSNLIEDLMSLSRIELRQHVRPTGSTDLASLLNTVVEGLQNQLQDAGLELQMRIESSDTRITGDHDELYEVFENLMDNAIKYGAGGGRIVLHLTEVTDRPGYAFSIVVQDFGEGIETEHVPRLTERFYRVDAESSRKKKGTGLGLAIVKHIVGRHRGQLSIRSRPGEGMRVEVLLPR